MNQILFYKKNNYRKNLRKFKIIFILSIILLVLFVLYYLYVKLNNYVQEKDSNTLLKSFNLIRLYSKDNNYTTSNKNNNNYLVIGTIEIPKINITYPILSTVNDDLLKKSVCRFYGPYPNKVGNMCIAGHNYDDSRFFGKLFDLSVGDTIRIYDLNNTFVNYSVYAKYEILKEDTSPTNQNTNGKREITLVTCNNFNKNRLIIKAKESY